MSRRINSELLLVGSLRAASTEEAVRVDGEFFGDLVFALPDGETGRRVLWAQYEYAHLLAPIQAWRCFRTTSTPSPCARTVTSSGHAQDYCTCVLTHRAPLHAALAPERRRGHDRAGL